MRRRYRLLVESRDGTWRVMEGSVNELQQYHVGTSETVTWCSDLGSADEREQIQSNDLSD